MGIEEFCKPHLKTKKCDWCGRKCRRNGESGYPLTFIHGNALFSVCSKNHYDKLINYIEDKESDTHAKENR